MSDRPLNPPPAGSETPDAWAVRLQATARQFAYPPTPDIAVRVTERLVRPQRPLRRRLVWAGLAALLLLTGLLAVPQVRAAIANWLQLGAVRIFLVEPTPTPAATAGPHRAATLRPVLSPTPLSSVLDLAGETSLAEARARVDFPIRLPAYPPDLGPPDRLFLQDSNGSVLVLVWLAPDRPDRASLSLHQLGPGAFAGKSAPRLIQETEVNGQPALWVEGPHLLQIQGDRYAERRLVAGHVLIWTEGDITYRLETTEALSEAIRIAESLR